MKHRNGSGETLYLSSVRPRFSISLVTSAISSFSLWEQTEERRRIRIMKQRKMYHEFKLWHRSYKDLHMWYLTLLITLWRCFDLVTMSNPWLSVSAKSEWPTMSLEWWPTKKRQFYSSSQQEFCAIASLCRESSLGSVAPARGQNPHP